MYVLLLALSVLMTIFFGFMFYFALSNNKILVAFVSFSLYFVFFFVTSYFSQFFN